MKYKNVSDSDNMAISDNSGINDDNEMINSDRVTGNISNSQFGERHQNMTAILDRSRYSDDKYQQILECKDFYILACCIKLSNGFVVERRKTTGIDTPWNMQVGFVLSKSLLIDK